MGQRSIPFPQRSGEWERFMDCERLETWKESEKSRVYLVRDRRCGELLVEKRLTGELEVYNRLR